MDDEGTERGQPADPAGDGVILLHLGVTFRHEAAAALADAARDEGMARSTLVRQIVEDWLRAQKRLPALPE